MGRNTIPKLGERYRVLSQGGKPGPDTGEIVTYEVLTPEGREILAAFFADGFEECVAAAFQAGFDKGMKAGADAARREIKKALGL